MKYGSLGLPRPRFGHLKQKLTVSHVFLKVFSRCTRVFILGGAIIHNSRVIQLLDLPITVTTLVQSLIY